ncbi:MAG TPA: hypothetical protein VHW01_04195 [Polyangiaceae bacterium]|nr:hypothetical protein [Polyangiaceae bacterium]
MSVRRLARLLPLLCALLTVTLGSKPASAQSSLTVEAVPVLGGNSPSVDGWGEVYVHLESNDSRSLGGFLELRPLEMGRALPRALSRVPFALAPKGRVSLLLPSHGLVTRMGAKVVAVDDKGGELGFSQVTPVRVLDPLLFDLTVPSRLAPVLSAQAMPIKRRGMSYSYGGSTLSVTTPQINIVSGEPVLPDLAAGYASVTVVLASGRTISSMPPPALDALVSWVLGGGALALVIDRPEDLHSSWLEALAGGRVQNSAAAHQLSAVTQFAVPVETSGSGTGGPPHIALESAQPSHELAATFFGLSGANLRVSPWGESCSYGLGEVHFLAFNPDSELGASDLWLRLKMTDLVRHAWERASVVALPHGESGLDDARGGSVRRVLDPNESTRWTVVVSTLLLLLYAGLAGPLNFYLAQRAGRPLRALVYLPVWAGVALSGIVVLGILGKGVSGRARHLTLIEAGAGMARASITRFRGLYGARSDDLTVRAARGSVLDVLGDPDEVMRDLVVDRDGLRLEKLREKPWEVQVVREDGFTMLAGGVSLVQGTDGRLAVKNRCARDLLSVVVKAPGQDFVYFPKIADGETVSVWRGRSLGSGPAGASSGNHALSVASFHDAVEQHAKGAGAAWEALEALTGSDADWWPSDVPVLIAELEGGEGRSQDSGLRLDIDRVLLRVVGYGGVP